MAHSVAPVPMPVHLAWPQLGYAPGLSMPVPLHMLAAHFPQAYSTAAGVASVASVTSGSASLGVQLAIVQMSLMGPD